MELKRGVVSSSLSVSDWFQRPLPSSKLALRTVPPKARARRQGAITEENYLVQVGWGKERGASLNVCLILQGLDGARVVPFFGLSRDLIFVQYLETSLGLYPLNVSLTL